MEKNEAKKLIEDTFNKPYNEEQSRYFITNLLPKGEMLDERVLTGQYIPDSFKEHISSYKRLAKFEDKENKRIDVLAVEVSSVRALENARTMQRNFIAHYLNGSGGGKSALVAFYSKETPDWRFSLVKMDYGLDPPKQKVKKELTPVRRYSFLVGENEGTHTACKQLASVLASDKDTDLKALEEAFSIEKVTKEFFNEYKGLYEKLKQEIEQHIKKDKTTAGEFKKKGVVLADFAKRLLGQIVFLYFLQKKGWLGVEKGKPWGSGSKKFLRELYDNRGAKNFFNDKLEPLFYEALATERTDNFYDQFKCRIPFLNGGLFEPINDYDWVNTDILLDDKIFQEIFEVFDLYNFTVREDEPLDKEVAVDPEMLGRVFENLIPENERKGSGTYYTPREIVHYMCQESLINYLDSKLDIKREDIEQFIHRGDVAQEHDTVALEKNKQKNYSVDYKIKLPDAIHDKAKAIDAALADVKICDPAIGSGAFPVGLMTEIVRARGLLNIKLGEEGRGDYDFKRHAIQESIYGVDIESSAVDIAKLRLWLSLVVDEEDFQTIQPLPNLDYKIMCGNSLLGIEVNLMNNPDILKLNERIDLFFDETSRSKKENYRKDIDALIARLLVNKERFDFKIYFNRVFRENDGFDIVIGNPPYVRQEKIKNDKPALKNSFGEFFNGTADLYTYFYKKGGDILKKQGVLCFITSNSFMRTSFGNNLREFLASTLQPVVILDFGDKGVFDATTRPLIYLGKKNNHASNFYVATAQNKEDMKNPHKLIEEKGFSLPIASLKEEAWALLPPNWLALGEKTKKAEKPLGLYLKTTAHTKIYRGVLTGLNEAFYIDEATKERLIQEDPKSEELIRPLLRGRDLKKWSADLQKYLITIPSSANKKWNWSNVKLEKEAEAIFIKSYPAISTYLLQYKDRLKKRDDKGAFYWELRSCAYYAEFDKPKIIYPTIGTEMRAKFDNKGFFVNDATFFIPKANKYLLAVLNSKAMDFFYRLNAPSLDNPFNQGYISFKGFFMEKLPIAEPDAKTRAQIEALVDKIHAAKERDPSADISALEAQIDTLIYRLYNLTKAEIQLIEKATQ